MVEFKRVFQFVIFFALGCGLQQVHAVAVSGGAGGSDSRAAYEYYSEYLRIFDEFNKETEFELWEELEPKDPPKPKVKDDYCKGRGKQTGPKEAIYCMLWGEISIFQSEIPQPDPNNPDAPVNPCDTDPRFPVDPKWQEMCQMHAKAAICRNWKYPPGLAPGQIECSCPPNMEVIPADRSSGRNWAPVFSIACKCRLPAFPRIARTCGWA